MISHATDGFWKLHDALPAKIQRQVKSAYQKFQQNPAHLSLQFKQIHQTKPIYSVRINRDYRVVGIKDGNEIIWFWVGSHSDYDKLLSRL